jgi:endonuclease YncB( thermonuclease family)
MRLLQTIAFAIALLTAYPAHADLAGGASVIDGDTIEIRRERIHLHGMNALQSAQLSTIEGKR